MSRRKAFLHIGVPGAGGALLDSVLLEHADTLREQGVEHPAHSADEMFRAALEITRDHKAWGYRRREVEGTWAEIYRRASKHRGPVVVGQELLAAATPEQIALMVDGLAGFEIHVVLTTRDPASQVVAGWAASVESGRSVSFPKFCRRVLDPAREHEQAQEFWSGQDLGDILDRWEAVVSRPEHVHVVVLPRDEAAQRAALLAAFGEIVGFDAARLPVTTELLTTSVDRAGVEVTRTVNRAIAAHGEGPAQRAVLRRYLPEGMVVAGGGPGWVPANLHDEVGELADGWAARIKGGGYDVHGDVSDLWPVRPEERALPRLLDVSTEERLETATNALAEMLVEVARLREHNAVLEAHALKLDRKQKRLKRRLAAAAPE
ncbi:MAG TPA: hypothetical protein VFT00_10035 [Nocardioides sp.]|nr:hypothetical protein [Nocardioides sp.]